VRKFPEHPPVLLTPIQQRTIELLHEWRVGICQHSRYKNDLRYIEEMCRLLAYKGYRFPNVAHATPMPGETIKSAEELEAEDFEANSAVLCMVFDGMA
jgi:hypothetical protein